MPVRHLTVRWRLTLLFGLAYLAVAALLIVTAYLIVRARLDARDLSVPDELRGTPLDPGSVGTGPEMSAELLTTLEGVRADLVDDTLSALLVWLSLAAILAGIAAIAAGWYTAGRALSPVRQVTATAQRLSERNLSERVGYHGPPDELAELAETFDSMLDRIEGAMDAQRQFTAMASHELRTPLAQITAATSLARTMPDSMPSDELIGIVEPAAGRAATLVDRLLELMRSRNGLAARQPIRLDEVFRDAFADEERSADERRLTTSLDLEPVTVDGDPVLLAALASNLIANAIAHNLDGGEIEIRTRAEGALAQVCVSNSGAPVTDAALRRITEPFQRGVTNPDGLGHGLGTTIVRTITDAHGGTASYTARPDGGVRVDVSLPMPDW